MVKILKARKVGSSLIVTIPQTIAQMQNITNGTKFELAVFPEILQLKIVR